MLLIIIWFVMMQGYKNKSKSHRLALKVFFHHPIYIKDIIFRCKNYVVIDHQHMHNTYIVERERPSVSFEMIKQNLFFKRRKYVRIRIYKTRY